MRTGLKRELWKMRQSRLFVTALILGIGIVCVDMLQNLILLHNQLRLSGGIALGLGGISLFYRWIGVNLDTVGYAWFYLLFPFLAALSFGWSYCEEANSGYLKQILVRSGRRNYFLCKTVVVFLSGAIVIGIPLLIDLLGSALFLPAETPDILSMQSPVWAGNFLSALYYTHPWAYSLLAVLMDMLWGGSIAVIALAVSMLCPNFFVTVLTPMLLFLMEDFIGTSCMGVISAEGGNSLMLSPLALLHIATVNPNPGWLIFCAMGVHSIPALLVIWFKGRKYEVY